MRIGSVGYATDQGLGYLMKSFYDNGVVTDVAIIHHGRRQTHPEWYAAGFSINITNLKSPSQIRYLKEWCVGLDAVLFFETPFEWTLIPHCRSIGVKTVMMPMYECMPKQWPFQPDAILNPSLLDQRYYPTGTHIPVPVNVSWLRRFRAEVFVHNAGHGGLLGRNGTAELIAAMQYVKSPIHLIIRTQADVHDGNAIGPIERLDKRIEVRRGTFPRESLYSEGDVFVFPERFNGLSLPLQEAAASGMAVMTTNRFPNTEHLPKFIPLNVTEYKRNSISRRTVEFDEAIVHPKTIAQAIDDTYGKDIQEYSLAGARWGLQQSWQALRSRYEEYFRCLTQKTDSSSRPTLSG